MRVLLLTVLLFAAAPALAQPASLPANLTDTGIDAPGVIAFTPQFPLWSDGTRKRRWLYLPPGTSIDASRAQAWEFPRGTKAWKEFAYERRVETRMIERLADGTWRFAVYIWNAEGTEATLAPARGAMVPAAGAPGGRYVVPSRTDCLACHEGAAVPILGFSAVQLSEELASLARQGLVKNLKETSSPRIPAALGYLHGNCGHCHNGSGPLADVGLNFAQPGKPRLPDDPALVVAKMREPNPFMRMPPLGVRVPDAEGIALVQSWIRNAALNRFDFSMTQEEHHP